MYIIERERERERDGKRDTIHWGVCCYSKYWKTLEKKLARNSYACMHRLIKGKYYCRKLTNSKSLKLSPKEKVTPMKIFRKEQRLPPIILFSRTPFSANVINNIYFSSKIILCGSPILNQEQHIFYSCLKDSYPLTDRLPLLLSLSAKIKLSIFNFSRLCGCPDLWTLCF